MLPDVTYRTQMNIAMLPDVTYRWVSLFKVCTDWRRVN